MQAVFPDSSLPSAALPGSALNNSGFPFRDSTDSPHLPGLMQGHNTSPVPSSVHVDQVPQSQPYSVLSETSDAGVSSNPQPVVAAPVKAPWNDCDDVQNVRSASSHNFASGAATVNLSLPSGNGAYPPASIIPEKNSDLHTDPHATQQSSDKVISSSSTDGSAKRSPTPPQKSSATATSNVDALNKQIAGRTAAMDAVTKEKEAKITAAAQEYLRALIEKREEEVMIAKEKHKKEQQVDAKKISDNKKSGAVWDGVGMLVDLQRPNQHSKSTEQMRSVLAALNTSPDKK